MPSRCTGRHQPPSQDGRRGRGRGGAKLSDMPSNALTDWKMAGLNRLTELEAVHATLSGTGRGRRWGTTQLNRSLSWRSQRSSRVAAAVCTMKPSRFASRRRSPRSSRCSRSCSPKAASSTAGTLVAAHLGSDFVRLGFDFVADLKAKGPLTVDRLEMLEVRKNPWPGGASPADRR